MPKEVPNKRYTPEFKKLVIETMQEEKLSYSETCRRFEVNSKDRIKSWERIYLEEGPEGFAVKRRGRSSKGRPPKRLPKEVTEDLQAEVQRLRAEVDYLKNLQALVLEDERTSTKNAGSSEAKAKTRTQYSALNRSTAPCNFLLSFEADTERRQIRICQRRNHNNFPQKQGQIRLPAYYDSAAQPRIPCES